MQKESRPGLKLILTSALPLPEHKRQAERIGAKGLVSSFDDMEAILECIRTVMVNESFFQAANTSKTLVTKQREGVNSRMDHPKSKRG